MRGRLPLVLGRFVPADVDVLLKRKQLHDLGQHILDERIRVLTDVEQPDIDAPVGGDGWLRAGHANLRIRGNRRLRMSGHVDFRDDRDVTFGCVAHDVADLVLGIETAILPGRRIDQLHLVGLRARHAPTSVNFGYFFIGLRQPGSSVRCQCITLSLCTAIVSMKSLMKSGDWKCRTESSNRPRQAEARIVVDLGARHALRLRARAGRGQQLPQTHGAVEQSVRSSGGERDSVRRYAQPIAFIAIGPCRCRLQLENNRVTGACVGLRPQREMQAMRAFDEIRKIARGGRCLFAADDQSAARCDFEVPGSAFYGNRHRYQRKRAAVDGSRWHRLGSRRPSGGGRRAVHAKRATSTSTLILLAIAPPKNAHAFSAYRPSDVPFAGKMLLHFQHTRMRLKQKAASLFRDSGLLQRTRRKLLPAFPAYTGRPWPE